MNLMHKMMFNVHRSKLDFDETVTALKASAEANGWDIPMTHDLQEKYQNAGFEDMTRVTTLYFCNPEGGYRILKDDANKPMAVMMPMGVSVYETQEGEVYIAGMALDKMSMMFGGVVKEVLRESATNYQKALDEVAPPVETDEVQVEGGRCCLGCLSLGAIVAALVGVGVFLMTKLIPKIMPKMIAKMMPKMMTMMDEAGVQPPCAQIILERMETQDA